MEVKCRFVILNVNGNNHYTCQIARQTIPDDTEELKIIRQHEAGKTDTNVTAIDLNYCQITKTPQKFMKIFPNLQNLTIYKCNLTSLTKADLTEYENLKVVNFEGNKIEFLPGNLFESFRNLEVIDFNRNDLILIEPDLLDGLDKLQHVDFRCNPNYDKYHSTIYSESSNESLEAVKQQLTDKFPNSFRDHYKLPLEASRQEIYELKMANEQLSAIKKFIQQDEAFKDFKIQVNEQEFAVHKVLLAAKSSVLAEMFRNNPEAENLNLVDISVIIFDKVLKFFYTDELPGDDVNFLHLFGAAGRLQVEELKNYAAAKLLDQIDAENAVECLKLSNNYQHDGLRQKAFDEIKKKYPKVEIKDELAKDVEKFEKILELLKKKEEFNKKLEEDFANLLKL